ncbi:tRNA nucleotidyltransferase/poly(A) polymerase family protein [Planktothrix paucivesiculata]|uniref:PolyA polymerase n=1 Tax=Planktothrix paucivesiculata PCC 9631 TaxID=671071 RepID=A0A7Z9BSJ6_9CYAN|nr:CCA tRNA nucleotidyltransferase [Planktothrix paucivesiculata]VXD20190.1 PolyA polymerase [Planktothrix paucivesiculata PCC 9631]
MSEALPDVFSPARWPFELSQLPQPAYLVGGAVRDGLVGRTVTDLDLDFVLLQDAVQTARTLAKYYGAGFVLLDAERQIARVVFKNITVDFAQAEGNSLEQDLRRRDFTVNAIAFDPFTQTFIDPNKGQEDLQRRLIKMISPENLQDDPLRLLRGYRQAAQLGFEIEAETKAAIQAFAPLLSQVAVERIRTELVYLFNTPNATNIIQKSWEVGLISPWFQSANQQFQHLSQMDLSAENLGKIYPQLSQELSRGLRETLKISILGIAKLSCLCNQNLTLAEAELLELKFSKIELKSVLAILKGLSQINLLKTKDLSLREQYFLFQGLGILFPAVIVRAMAAGFSLETLSPLINRYLNPNDPIAYPQLLLTGNELMEALKLRPSPKIGELLLEIQLGQIEGKITTIEQAIAYAQQLL